MAEVSDSGGRGGRRSTSAELNLVPFIDLMSVLITFLLTTAVWTQISMMQIGSSIYGKKSSEVIERTLSPEDQVVLRLDVMVDGYRLHFEKEKYFVAKTPDGYDGARVIEFLKTVREKYPNKKDAVISMDDTLEFEHLVHAMDIFLQAEIPNISVSTGGPA